MRRTITYPIVLLVLFLFCWINVPKGASDGIRSLSASLFSYRNLQNDVKESSALLVENQKLRMRLDAINDRILADLRTAPLLKEAEYVKARVIYRDPSSWSSSVWVNVGEETNQALKAVVVAKNSPVISDGALVGVVDYVGAKQARIRLITDSGLSPSVKVARGGLQNREIAHQMQGLLRLVENRDDLFESIAEKKQFITQLMQFKSKLPDWEDGYLATGELHGSSSPLWRARNPILKGIGFHFEGTAPLFKEGDMLVTSGLDGVFPAGLKVGTVYKLEEQKTSYAYNMQVRPLVGNLNDLQTLFILSPVSE